MLWKLIWNQDQNRHFANDFKSNHFANELKSLKSFCLFSNQTAVKFNVSFIANKRHNLYQMFQLSQICNTVTHWHLFALNILPSVNLVRRWWQRALVDWPTSGGCSLLDDGKSVKVKWPSRQKLCSHVLTMDDPIKGLLATALVLSTQ